MTRAQLTSERKAKLGSELKEGVIERVARVPSDFFLWGAFGAMAFAAICEVTNQKDRAAGVRPWVPTLLTLGVYNKLMKMHGPDAGRT